MNICSSKQRLSGSITVPGSKSHTIRALILASLAAGVHVIMLSEKLFGQVAENLLEQASKDREFARKLRDAEKKVIEYKLKCGILKVKDVDGKKKIVLAQAAATLSSSVVFIIYISLRSAASLDDVTSAINFLFFL